MHIKMNDSLDDLDMIDAKLRINVQFIKNIWKYSKLNFEKIKDDVDLFYAFPRRDIIKRFWNIPENEIFKKIRSLKYNPVEIN